MQEYGNENFAPPEGQSREAESGGTPLARYQRALFCLLREFDRVCRKYNIRYTLFAGTALGAVRHRGFIPWDDDVDVVLSRPEYERFLALAPGELGEEYYLQKEFSAHWPMFFSKLRKNNTTCLERYTPRDLACHQGIYIDIFPCDNLADGPLARRAQFAASKIVIAKALDRRGYDTDSRKKKLFIRLCRLLPGGGPIRFVRRDGDRGSRMVHTFFGGASRYEKNIYPRQWFQETVELPFEDGSFPVSAHYDELLTRLYGDYRTLPPPEARGRKVHGEFVDLERSYELYRGKRENMTFQEYSRSIR